MEPNLLEYYNTELTYMHEQVSEFARLHPKIARRLGIHGIEVADPYVERLIESFCFLSARMQIKLDAEFPRFTQRLLEVIYPNYVAPTPSMSVAKFFPSLKLGELSNGHLIPRGANLRARNAAGETTQCEFVSGQDVTLWPIQIVDAKLTPPPPDLPNLQHHLTGGTHIHAALRLRLRTDGKTPFSALTGLDRLSIYLSGDESTASHLFELIHAGTIATLVAIPGQLSDKAHITVQSNMSAVSIEGIKPEQSLLPLQWNSFHGTNLAHEFFACPSRFYFFALEQLRAGLGKIDGHEAEIVILLDRTSPHIATHQVDANQFALYCTPVINLFQKRTDRVELLNSQTEFHLVADRSKPLDYEIFSLLEVTGQSNQQSKETLFRPLFQSLNQDEGNWGRYFSIRREARRLSDNARKYGTRSDYIGTEVFISLVDQHEAPYASDIRYLSINALVTNRDLPVLIPRNGVNDLTCNLSLPVDSIGLIRPPSRPNAPFSQNINGNTAADLSAPNSAEQQNQNPTAMAWKLIRMLNFNHLPLVDMPHRAGGQALRDLLRMSAPGNDPIIAQQISGLVGSQIKPVTKRIPDGGPLVYGRGVRCQLTVDEGCFSGISPYLFGLVMEHLLARHVSINSFTECELISMQRGQIKVWPARMGLRNAI